jgi:hypothetical protein
MTRKQPRPRRPERNETYFLNVDLDVFARSPLEPLAAAFGSSVIALYVGRDGKHFRAHFELSASGRKNADALIAAFVQLVKGLPRAARLTWNRASRRDFNIGIQAGFTPASFEIALNAGTLRLASSVNAHVVVTVYGAERVPGV